MPDLRSAIVIDYQNLHLTGRGLFSVSRNRPVHESLVDLLNFANQWRTARNNAQHPGMDHAVVSRVEVYRGEPSAEHDAKAYARNQAQKSIWERDPRVAVTLRPLKYRYEFDDTGRRVIGPDGKWVVKGKDEKGFDVLLRLSPRAVGA